MRVRTIPIQNKDWQWSLGFTYSYNKNKIKKISNALREQNEINLEKGGVAPLPIYEEGQSLTAIKVVPSAGIDPVTGQEIYIKRDGSYTFVYDPNDKVIFGDTNPYGIGAVNSYLTYPQLRSERVVPVFVRRFFVQRDSGLEGRRSRPKV